MMGAEVLITFASWEDRFKLGFQRNLEGNTVRKAVVFFFQEYSDWTQENRDVVDTMCKRHDIGHFPERLRVNETAENWRIVTKALDAAIREGQGVLVDISTMPREIIWYVMWQIEHNTSDKRYVYYSPKDYGEDWLSRNPQAPRLVYKLSGLAAAAAKTALLVTVGFDLQRVKRLIGWYEPAKVLIGFQSTSQFARNNTTMAGYRETLEREYEKECDCETFELDAFCEDRGLSAIQEQLERLDRSYNVIMGSLGPKLTAVTLYRLQRLRQERGLVYAPSNQYSRNYSIGIGDRFEGTL